MRRDSSLVPESSLSDVRLMEAALAEAQVAAEDGEVPVGAVITDATGLVIASGHNRTESLKDPTAHAEVLAIREAAARTGDWRLSGCVLYVTLEPCIMCLGAVVNSRIETVVFGAYDETAGALESNPPINFATGYRGGVLESRCGGLIRDFFRGVRRERSALRS